MTPPGDARWPNGKNAVVDGSVDSSQESNTCTMVRHNLFIETIKWKNEIQRKEFFLPYRYQCLSFFNVQLANLEVILRNVK